MNIIIIFIPIMGIMGAICGYGFGKDDGYFIGYEKGRLDAEKQLDELFPKKQPCPQCLAKGWGGECGAKDN